MNGAAACTRNCACKSKVYNVLACCTLLIHRVHWALCARVSVARARTHGGSGAAIRETAAIKSISADFLDGLALSTTSMQFRIFKLFLWLNAGADTAVAGARTEPISPARQMQLAETMRFDHNVHYLFIIFFWFFSLFVVDEKLSSTFFSRLPAHRGHWTVDTRRWLRKAISTNIWMKLFKFPNYVHFHSLISRRCDLMGISRLDRRSLFQEFVANGIAQIVSVALFCVRFFNTTPHRID